MACGGGGAPEAGLVSASPQAVTSTATPAEASAGVVTALSNKTAPPKPIPQPANTEGRLLASNCFQCHGTLGTGGFDSIRGTDAREVLEFLNKPASSQIMAAHAQGYTPAQLQKIIAYLQQ